MFAAVANWFSLAEAHRALELLEDYHSRLGAQQDRALRIAIERVIRIFKSRLFQALLGESLSLSHHSDEEHSHVLKIDCITCFPRSTRDVSLVGEFVWMQIRVNAENASRATRGKCIHLSYEFMCLIPLQYTNVWCNQLLNLLRFSFAASDDMEQEIVRCMCVRSSFSIFGLNKLDFL